MTSEPGRDNRCPLCGGHLTGSTATIPFVFPETVVVVKAVPAEVCGSCQEPYMDGVVTDRITDLVDRLRTIGTEVSVISFEDARATVS